MPQEGQIFEVDPNLGTIRSVLPDGNLSEPWDSVNIGGYDYRLAGTRLQRIGGSAVEGIQLGSAGPTVVIGEPQGRDLVRNTIQVENVNQPSGQSAYYGVGGDVDAILTTGERATISVDFEYVAAEGMRLARRTLDDGSIEYFEAPITIATNQDLRALMLDETAEFLSGREAAIQAIFRHMLRYDRDVIERLKPGDTKPSSNEIRQWINSNMTNLVGYSKQIVPYAY